MRVVLRFFVVFFGLTGVVLGQSRLDTPAPCVRLHKLVLESGNLPKAERDWIIHSLEGKVYGEDEIGERVRQSLRDLGYMNAAFLVPQFSFPTADKGLADVSIRIDPGNQYHLNEIQFLNATVFPSDQLQSTFSLRSGDLFNATEVARGIEHLRMLYSTRGYLDMVVSPNVRTDETSHTVSFVMEIDEGRTYNFGKLYLEGVEPRPGAAKALQNSWKPMEGKLYNSDELQHWLQANHFDWKVSTLASKSIKTTLDPGSRLANITLTQWPR